MPAGWQHVFDGIDGHDQPVSLVHEDTEPLRRMAVFDVLVNNADRKGGHVLEMADGHRYGVDHGVTFHVEHKLRTVLWGWLGEPRARGRPRRGAPASARRWPAPLGDVLAGAPHRPGDRRRRHAGADRLAERGRDAGARAGPARPSRGRRSERRHACA